MTETTLRLSEAMRLGGMQYKQCFGSLIEPDGQGGLNACAIGAALLAIGRIMKRSYIVVGDLFPDNWKFVKQDWACPECGVRAGIRSGYRIITHLNDDHRWTVSAIADWVELHESPPEPRPQPVQVPVPDKPGEDEPDEEPVTEPAIAG